MKMQALDGDASGAEEFDVELLTGKVPLEKVSLRLWRALRSDAEIKAGE